MGIFVFSPAGDEAVRSCSEAVLSSMRQLALISRLHELVADGS